MPSRAAIAWIAALIVAIGTPVVRADADNALPVAVAGDDQEVTAVGCTGRVRLDASGSSDPDGDPLRFVWWSDYAAAAGSTVELDLPAGTHTVELIVSDARGGTASDTLVVTVLPDVTPALLASATATPDVLIPPNHEMVPVAIDVALTGGCEATTMCSIVGVSSSAAGNPSPDGNSRPDWEITGSLTLLLRAERDARSVQGRVYTIAVGCEGTFGERSSATATVTVPR